MHPDPRRYRIQLVVDGTSRRVTDDGGATAFCRRLHGEVRVAGMAVRDGAVRFEDGNGGYVYAVRAETVFAFVEEPFTSTRWRLRRRTQAVLRLPQQALKACSY